MDYKETKGYKKLKTYLQKFNGIAIAFSGGVDSSFLLAVAKEVLADKVLALTVKNAYIPNWEVEEAKAIARSLGVPHIILEPGFPEIIRENPPDRCYLCKKAVFSMIWDTAKKHGIQILADGSNADDTQDYRPGMKALEELHVVSPLLEVGLGKNEIRDLSKAMGLPTYDKPAYACLLTRIPYNTTIQPEILERIEKAELILHQEGMKAVRVRTHESLARIELAADYWNYFSYEENRKKLYNSLKDLGFTNVTIDLGGYKMGGGNNSTQ